MSERGLLAVDLGLRAGLALFDRRGRLRWYRSTNFGTTARMKAAVPAIIQEAGPPAVLAIEGGGRLAVPWRRFAERVDACVVEMHAGDWRRGLLLDREQRTGSDAKASAITYAADIIAWSGAPAPTSRLRDDAAEAILCGLWAASQLGWVDGVPRR